ncbi:MAG: methyltransferase, partial [Nitrospina sp.]|nr:methyltransferase [Nitrospina sp.]
SGGSIALYCSKNNRPETSRLKKKLEMDENSGLGLKEKWLEFSEKCFDHKNKLIEVVKTHSGNGTKMIGYGASARSSTLLNFCGIDHRHLTCIADGNPIKHGKFTAGTDIPIVSPGEAFAKNPDTVLLLGWNFKDEILKIIKDQYQFHGKVILPLPNDPQIIEL